MKKTTMTILLAIIFVGGFLIFYQNRPVEQKMPVADQADQQIIAKQNWESKIDDQASIIVTATPIDISLESKEWKFDIVMDTHSVELDQDIAKVAALVDDSGKEHKPLRWEGAPAGGHHREGALIFNQITPTPKFVELKISGIGGVVRSFIWQLK